MKAKLLYFDYNLDHLTCSVPTCFHALNRFPDSFVFSPKQCHFLKNGGQFKVGNLPRFDDRHRNYYLISTKRRIAEQNKPRNID